MIKLKAEELTENLLNECRRGKAVKSAQTLRQKDVMDYTFLVIFCCGLFRSLIFLEEIDGYSFKNYKRNK